MRQCIDCDKTIHFGGAIRCIDCNLIKRRATAKANKEKYQYHKQPKYRYNAYKRGAEKRGYEFLLTVDEFTELWNKPCHYCNVSIEGIGIDRKDNSLGYTLDNTVTCCTQCNWMKNTIGYKEFIDKCIMIANHCTGPV